MPSIDVGGYEPSSLLGEGAFSKVYKGVAKPGNNKHATHQFVAIKVVKVPPSSASQSEADHKRKILKEVKLHKLLQHYNVLRLINYTEQESDSIWIVLEYAEGGDLFDKITPDVGISEELAHLYFYQLLAALNYCHHSGVAHRDIKPENMLLDRNGNLKLADFGLAALFSYQGKEKKLAEACGSAPYAAPELALGVPYRAQPIDVWSAGVVLFTILVGNTPWDQPTSASQEYEAYLNGDLQRQDPWTRIPQELMSLLQGILHPNPKERLKIADVAQHSWFCISNPLLGKDGQVKSAATVWNSLFAQLEENGEFQVKSGWSDSTGSAADSHMGSQTMIDSQTEAPMASLPRSQGKARDVFSQVGMDVDDRESRHRTGYAKEAVKYSQHASMRIKGEPQAFTAAASRHSQVSTFAPSQATNPNITRFFTYHSSDIVAAAIGSAMEQLKRDYRAYESLVYQRGETGQGEAIKWAAMDRRKQAMQGKIEINYEATQGDFEAVSADASYAELVKFRQQADRDATEEATIQPGCSNPVMVPRKGQGQGGYVVSMPPNWGKGSPLEKKFFYKELEKRLPQGLILVR